ncbi:MAG TPA: hypothetical protein VKU44_05045, partial [Terriglobia bacterium]|nr:hypothetical protein [Terriglobia bacterium]
MRPLDFLKQDAKTPLRRRYVAAGAVFEISTNSEPILAVADETFPELTKLDRAIDCRLRFWVDPAAGFGPPWPKPFFRGLGHLIFAGFDAQNSLLADLRGRRVIGRFSPLMSRDPSYWKTVIFPVLMTMVGATVGVTELHCACVERHGDGLLLAGVSGSGKSTLSLALAQAGFGFLSDDRTYLSRQSGRLVAWGLPTRLKVRREAAAFFPELRAREPGVALNGERAFEIDPEAQLHLRRARSCEPRRLIFLEPPEAPGTSATPIFDIAEVRPDEAAARLTSDLLPETAEAAAAQRQAVDELVKLPAYRLLHGGDPQTVARELVRWCEAPPAGDSAARSNGAHIPSPTLDPLRRFIPTPLAASLPVMGRTVRLETNSGAVLDQVRRLLGLYPGPPPGEPAFLWRIVAQADPAVTLPWPEVSAFSEPGLRYVTFGHRSFAAVDLEARQAVAFLADSLATDEPGFSAPFLERLFLLTSGALGLTAVGAACVSMGQRALLVFGPPMSGKTTSCYLATRLGLEFPTDQAAFLEATNAGLRAWGEFWPTAFRADTLHFLPELEPLTRRFQYRDLS